MNAGIKSEKLHINFMSCVNCQNKIEKSCEALWAFKRRT